VYEFNVFFNSLNFTLVLPLDRILCYDPSCSAISFLVDDLVKGLLDLVSTAAVDEGKSNFLSFLHVVLAQGISSSYRAGWGENSLCGE
jgi:hypothetical protein